MMGEDSVCVFVWVFSLGREFVMRKFVLLVGLFTWLGSGAGASRPYSSKKKTMQLRGQSILIMAFLFLFSQVADAATILFNDNFSDASIDPSLWVSGGINRGNSSSPGGGWTSTQTESGSTLELNVQGPSSGGTNGADAWLRTTYDYNDTRQHLINFSWQPLITENHFNPYQIQLTDGFIPASAGVHWFDAIIPGTTNLLQRDGTQAWYLDESESGPPGLPMMDWSITIDPAGSASLYDGANGGGTQIGIENLDMNSEWFLRFYLADATSAGFGAGEASFVLNSVSSNVVPEPNTALLLGFGLVGLGIKTRRRRRPRGAVHFSHVRKRPELQNTIFLPQ